MESFRVIDKRKATKRNNESPWDYVFLFIYLSISWMEEDLLWAGYYFCFSSFPMDCICLFYSAC